MDSLPSLVRRAGRASAPEIGLAAIAALRTQLEALERHHVAAAMAGGWTWTRVAQALGVSKQAAHKRHARALRDAQAVPSGASVTVTGDARAAVRYAREEARAVGERVVGTEHLLIGVLRTGTGPAVEVLRRAGVTLEGARPALQPTLAEEDRSVAEHSDETATAAAATGVSPLARACLEHSLRESVKRGDHHLGVEHLLLALLSDASGGATRTLERLEASPTEIRLELQAQLD